VVNQIKNDYTPFRTRRLSHFLTIYSTFGYILLIYSLLYNYSTMSYSYIWKEILFAFSLIVIVIFCLSFILGVFSCGIEAILSLIFPNRKKIDILTTVTVITLSLILIVIARYNLEFVKRLSLFGSVFTYHKSLSSLSQHCLKLATFAAVFTLIAVSRKQILRKFEEFIAVFKYCGISLLLLSVIASCVLLVFTKTTDYRRQTPSQFGDISRAKPQKPNIILLTYESLSASKMSLYNHKKTNTPRINKLAEESYVFDNMRSASNITAGSMPSIIEGVHQSVHKVYYSSFIDFKHSNRNLADALSDAGYKTYAFEILNQINARRWWEYEGSFSYIEPALGEPNVLEDISLKYDIPLYPWLLKIAKEDLLWPLKSAKFFYKKLGFRLGISEGLFANDILRKIEQTAVNSEEPYFIWAYLPDLHPFYLPESYRKRFLRENIKNIYYNRFGKQIKAPQFHTSGELDIINKIEDKIDESIAFLDEKLGEFVQFLKDKDMFDNCILIITADHGVSFRRGFGGHSSSCLSEELVHIPLILHVADQKDGKRISSPASHVDIAPTILELCDINKAESMEGESLVPFMKDENLLTHKPKFSMALRIVKKQVEGGTVAVLKDGYKMIFDLDENKAELYNIYKDPGEKENILGDRENIAEILNKLILKSIKRGK